MKNIFEIFDTLPSVDPYSEAYIPKASASIDFKLQPVYDE